ncbi:bactofilin [Paenibacillus sp. H1-7]|uniref:bactofilin n=1 Tax=Paenibacillus sp. H1-7 TaxID=2282849 RepID=UPI001EF86F95|nr:bactofilin [Paenibacillus sp. H1-7]ULL14558.1 bactofilin [Paenibacillus sp. H1-7]
MAEVLRRKLVLSGSGSASGGTYQEVKVSGECTIYGHLDCTEFKIYGTSHVEGDVKTSFFKIMGNSIIVGSVDAADARIYGESDIGGDLSVQRLKLFGSVKVGGSLTGDTLSIGGEASVQKDCEAETFKVNGGFTIGGLLNAGLIEIVPYGPCHAREIGGGTIKVQRSGIGYQLHKLFHFATARDHYLTADTIEGDTIHLEYTKARVVRGARVVIGPGCQIETVEYKESLELSADAVVKQHVKV